ncbi:plasma protease C1 inhibitor precursor [Larimichthys crocea]|uniref:C1 inhibitor n=1 Tax=Larimichthys crocea TaxID=215358 RepID=C7ACU9_LARCR|nr:plasma protease C1 inhibitor precursor [Larimichthys crocea]ACS83543.1 C1 inhibitor [Larimichthys crocea]
MKLQAVLLLLLQLTFELSSCTHLRVVPGATLELPCLSIQTEFTDGAIIWTFNDENVTAQSPGSITFKKRGLLLSISPVTDAHEGKYMCLVKDSTTEIIRTYHVTVEATFGYAIKVNKGTNVYLPCHFPPSSQVKANALWFKETRVGQRIQLHPGDGSTDEVERLEQLYPLDHDQTIVLREVLMEDAGSYTCESPENKKLSTVDILVEVPPTLPPHSCKIEHTAPWEPCQDTNSRTGEPILQESLTEFSTKLYSLLRQWQPSSNLLFSPISISALLSHLLLGARDNARRAIERAVCVPHDFHCVHFQMKKLREKLSGSLQMASQIFYDRQMNLSESFTNQSIQFYGAEPVRLLESGEESKQMINSWVANKTNNKIKHLVDSVPSTAQLILLNAVSFSGQWKVKFELKPQKGLFSKLDGDLIKVPVLYQKNYMMPLTYIAGLKAQVGKFALTDDSSLYILLPPTNTATHLQTVEQKMTDTAVREMIEHMKTVPAEEVEVTLPLIKLDVQTDMNILIKKLGLSSLFEGANLCGLYSEEKVVLDDARHRAFLTLTEQGVEAGAVSSFTFSRSFSSFSVLRPFILLLWSDQANVPLFIGRVTEP